MRREETFTWLFYGAMVRAVDGRWEIFIRLNSIVVNYTY